MKARVINFIKKIKENNVLIVTHDGCMKAIICETLDLEFNSNKYTTKTDQVHILNISNKGLLKFS